MEPNLGHFVSNMQRVNRKSYPEAHNSLHSFDCH